MTTIRPGGLIRIDKRMFGVCARCNCLIRIDKPILGSLHVCEARA